jgi:phage terminase small subunit
MPKPKEPPPPPVPPPEPPADLSERSQALWRTLVPSRVSTPQRLTYLEQALFALDGADQARATVAREGQVVTTEGSGVPHAHPCVKIEREARAQFGLMWARLELASQFRNEPDPLAALLRK